MNFSNELEHYGVLGMRWGKRKAGVKTSASTRKQARKLSDRELTATNSRIDSERKYNEARRPTKSKNSIWASPRRMSDKELQSRLNRMRMEKEYLTIRNAKFESGKKLLNDVLSTVATTMASEAAKGFMNPNSSSSVVRNYVQIHTKPRAALGGAMKAITRG